MLAEVVALNEGLDMLPSLLQSLVLVRLDRGFPEGPVHAFDHAVRPRVIRLGMRFRDAIELADALEDVTDACVGDTASEAFLSRKGHAVFRQKGMHAVQEGPKHLSKELCCIGFRGPVKERGMREFVTRSMTTNVCCLVRETFISALSMGTKPSVASSNFPCLCDTCVMGCQLIP